MNLLTKFSVGQYVHGNRSWLRIIDSRLKIIIVMIFLITPIWAGPIWRLSLVGFLLLITFLSFLPSRVWWRSLFFLSCLSLLIGCISIIASSDIQSLDGYLRNPNELQVVLESYKEWNILQIPAQKIWFINFGPYNLSRKAFELGIKTSRIIAPAIALSIFMTGLTFYFNDNLVPASNKLAETTLRTGMGSSVGEEKGKSNIMFSRYGSRIKSSNKKPTKSNTYLTHIFYASRYENNLMKKITLLDFSRQDIQQILKAKTGRFDKKNSSWIFSEGNIISISPEGQTTNVQFKKYTYPFVEGPMELAKVPKDANEMSLKQALKAEMIYKKTGNLKEIRRIKVRIQEKFTLPCACLVFGLIGSSLGSKSNLRSSKSQGFGLSVILILIYYVMSFVFSSFGVKGILSPIFAAWLPVLISIGGGIYFLRKSSSL